MSETRVHVNNLDFKADPHTVRAWFFDRGWDLRDCYVPRDRAYPGFRNKGYCFIEFDTPEQAEEAIDELSGVDGPGDRPMRMTLADPRRNQD
jgi:RNA recognition motif-containing protein